MTQPRIAITRAGAALAPTSFSGRSHPHASMPITRTQRSRITSTRLVRRDRPVELGGDGLVEQEEVAVADASLVVAVVADQSFVVSKS